MLEKGCVYVVPLMESLALRSRTSGIANPKSSIGRLDVFTRLITDYSAVFDQVAPGYKGPMFAEISPRTFSVVVREGTSVSQLRLRRGSPPVTDTAIRRLHETVRLVDAGQGQADIDEGIAVTVDLRGAGGRPVGWRARRHTDLIDLGRIDHYDPHEFWEPIHPDGRGSVVLNPGDFYILASKEAVTVPPDHAAEMRPYDTRVGEFRVHYAGFFDPGFGFASGGEGSRAVLEIPLLRGAVRAARRPARRSPRLRATDRGAGQAVRRRHRLLLPAPRPATGEAVPAPLTRSAAPAAFDQIATDPSDRHRFSPVFRLIFRLIGSTDQQTNRVRLARRSFDCRI